MANFTYRAYDAAGKMITGVIEADEKALAIAKLQQSECFPLEVKEQGEKEEGQGLLSMDIALSLRTISPKDVMYFSNQLSSMLDAGLQLDRSLGILSELAENPKLKAMVDDIRQSVQRGSTFSDALARHPKAFSRLYVNMVKAGESGGVLELVMRQLAEFLENTQKLKEDISSALRYPMIVTIVAGLAIIILLTYVVPRFSLLFSDMGQSLPFATQLLITISSGMINYWWVIITCVAVVYLSFKSYIGSEDGRQQWDALKLKMPVIGTLIQKIEVSRFSRTLGTLIRSGVPILAGVSIVKDIISNTVISRSMLEISSGLKEGEGIANPLKQVNLFPPLAMHMIQIGEETGQLDNMLLKVADTYDGEVRETIKRLISMLEPLLISITGLIVAFIVVAMLLAIFNIYEVAM